MNGKLISWKFNNKTWYGLILDDTDSSKLEIFSIEVGDFGMLELISVQDVMIYG